MDMEFDINLMFGIDPHDLYYKTDIAGFDGECFSFSIYFDVELTEEKFQEMDKAIEDFITPYNDKDIYLGYIDVTQMDNKGFIYLDLGNVEAEEANTAIKGILKALNQVSDIQSVVINEDFEFEF